MKHLVNFADSGFEHAQRLNAATALRRGGFDTVHRFSPKDIEPTFLDTHGEILRQRRGSGYWLWKPHFIQRVLDSARDGDFVFDSDAGAMFIRKVDHFIAAIDRAEVDVPDQGSRQGSSGASGLLMNDLDPADEASG